MATILVGNLPRSADRALLQMLFEEKVARTAWSSTGQFVLVELTDSDYAARVLAARDTFEMAKQDAVLAHTLAPVARLAPVSSTAAADGVERNAGATTEEDGSVKKKSKRVPRKPAPVPQDEDEEGDATAAAAAEPVCDANDPVFLRFVRRVIVDQFELFISRCATTIGDLIACDRRGEALRKELGITDPIAEKRKSRKHEGDDVAVSSASATDAAEQVPSPKTASKNNNKRDRAPDATTSASTKSGDDASRVAKKGRSEDPSNTKAKEGAVSSVVASTPSNVVVKQEQAPAAAVAAAVAAPPAFNRTSKDQCKFCGSEDHLSRHCPTR